MGSLLVISHRTMTIPNLPHIPNLSNQPNPSNQHNQHNILYLPNLPTVLCALVNKPSGASAGASDLKY